MNKTTVRAMQRLMATVDPQFREAEAFRLAYDTTFQQAIDAAVVAGIVEHDDDEAIAVRKVLHWLRANYGFADDDLHPDKIKGEDIAPLLASARKLDDPVNLDDVAGIERRMPSSIARTLRRKNRPVVKIGKANHAERADCEELFAEYRKVMKKNRQRDEP